MQTILIICVYFGYIFVSHCAIPNDNFKIDFQWSHINYTWHSHKAYQEAINSKKYIPENNAISGIKIYKDKLYTALPRLRPGTPVTLASVNINEPNKINSPLEPFPSWKMNALSNCANLQSVQSMEIDTKGIMWIIDGNRLNNLTSCPAKLVMIDLNNSGKIVFNYIFKNEIALHQGGFLNDIVIDESDGGYAYITDNSVIDPGLVVYSRQENKAWKLRDKSMFAELEATNFTLDGVTVTKLTGINGIALSPKTERERLVYYSPLIGFNLYAISTKILKNETYCRADQWRKFVKNIGKKPAQSDGFIIDNKGNLYYGLLSTYGLGKWNIYEPFDNNEQFDFNADEFIWPDSFSMDLSGNLYVITNEMFKFADGTYPLTLTDKIKFRIWKTFTGNKNYLFS